MIYLSGPITSNGKSVVENKAILMSYEMELKRAGLDVMNPGRLDVPGWDQNDYVNFWLMVIASPSIDVVAMIPGWEHSKGASREHKEAKRIGKEVFYLN